MWQTGAVCATTACYSNFGSMLFTVGYGIGAAYFDENCSLQ